MKETCEPICQTDGHDEKNRFSITIIVTHSRCVHISSRFGHRKHGPNGRPLRRFLPVRVRQLHQRGDHRRRQDVAHDVQLDQRFAAEQTAHDRHRANSAERTETVQNGQDALQIVHGQR